MKLELVLILCALVSSSAGAQEPDVEALYGRRVAALTFDGDAPVDAPYLTRLTELGPGRVLTRPGLRVALRNLFATRLFSDLSAEAAPEGDDVDVVIRFSAAPRVEKLTLTGVDLPQRGKLLDAIALGPRDTWSERAGDDAVRAVARLLAERGYFEARVKPIVEAGSDETSVLVRFDIVKGRHARSGPPLFSAATDPLGPDRIRSAAKLKEGSFYRETKARDDAARYEALYHKEGRARAEVRFDRTVYDAPSGVARARYTLFVGSRVVLTVKGAPESAVKKHPDSPWTKGEPPDEESVRKLAESLKRSYQEKGHAKARVDVAFHTTEQDETIAFTIEPGGRYVVAHVSYEGIRSVPLADVLDLVRTRPRGVLETGRLVDRDLAYDREVITGLYRSRGYPDARVAKTAVTDGLAPFTLDVALQVDEGPRVLVDRRTVTGEKVVPETEIAPLLVVAPGKPYNPAKVDADVAKLRSFYADRGFIDARVDGAARLTSPQPPRPLTADVAYSIFEGDPVTFGTTVVRGNRRTRLGVITRELAYKEGKPFSLAKLIESQQKLTGLGVFSRVELSSFPTDPDTGSRTVVLTVSEGKPWSILYGVGAEYSEGDKRFSPRLSLGISYANLFGRALSIGGEGRFSARETRFLATARDRSLFDLGLPVSLTVFRAREIRPTFEVARRGTFLEAEKRHSSRVKTTYRYQYEIVQPKADNPAILSGLERQNQSIAISSVSPGITYDSRDDPIEPRSGYFLSSDLKYAFSFLNANARFVKGLAQGSTYRSYGKTVFAFNLRIGAIESFATCDAAASPGCPPNLEIPVAERFFGGGRTSHRAFSLDDLGIFGQTLTVTSDGTVSPAGGNGLVIGNLEWRIPVFGDFGVSLFFDTGNVWSDFRKVRVSEFRNGLGLGLHYTTPVGPIRLEYGRKLDRKTVVLPDGTLFRESPGAFSFSVGYPF
jgi:outer membrane protein insertion porin family